MAIVPYYPYCLHYNDIRAEQEKLRLKKLRSGNFSSTDFKA